MTTSARRRRAIRAKFDFRISRPAAGGEEIERRPRKARLFAGSDAPQQKRGEGGNADDCALNLRAALPCDTEPRRSRGELRPFQGGFPVARGDEPGRGPLPGAGRRAGNQSQDNPMPVLLNDYLPLVIFIALSAVISGALLVAPFLLAFKAPDAEKLSAYECGFNAFDDARMKFDVRFYLVSLLFIIFDLEVAFLFPWAVAFRKIGVFGFWSMMAFLGVLTVGFIYEWKKGALEWE